VHGFANAFLSFAQHMLPPGLEPGTLRLLAVRSNQLSYRSVVWLGVLLVFSSIALLARTALVLVRLAFELVVLRRGARRCFGVRSVRCVCAVARHGGGRLRNSQQPA
jgi:hypothetical protein